MATDGPRFRVDDYVYFSAQMSTRHKQVPPGRFVVVAVLPRDPSGSHQYRVKPTDSGPLRLATELELRR